MTETSKLAPNQDKTIKSSSANEQKLADSKSTKEKTKQEPVSKKSEKAKKAQPEKQAKKDGKKKKAEEAKPVDLSKIKTHYEHRRMLRR